MVLMLPEVRKTGLTIVPITMSRASAGSSARSRSRATTILRAPWERHGLRRRSRSGAAVRHAQIPSIEATRALSLHPASCSATIRAVAHDQHAVAGPQIFQFAADHQDRLALPPHVLDDPEQRFLRLHVDAGGRVHQNQDRGGVGERAPHHDLLLVAAGQAGDQLLRPLGDDPQRVDRRVGRSKPAARRDEAERPEPARDRHGRIVGDRQGEDQTLPVPALRDAADPERERRRNVAGAQGSWH